MILSSCKLSHALLRAHIYSHLLTHRLVCLQERARERVRAYVSECQVPIASSLSPLYFSHTKFMDDGEV